MGGRGSSLPVQGDFRRFIETLGDFTDFFPLFDERSEFSLDSDGISKHFRKKSSPIARAMGAMGCTVTLLSKTPRRVFRKWNFEKVGFLKGG